MDWSHTVDIEGGSLVCRPLTPSRFPHLDRVMGEKVVTRKCFCMHWRRPDGGYRDARDNRGRFAERVGEGRPPGLVGYVGDEPVGWVQVGPREEFPTIYRSRLLRPLDDVEAWAINCFVVRSEFRRRRVAQGLLDAASVFAAEQGAAIIEGYPVDGERSSVVDYFTGTLGMFSRRGFAETERRNETRPIVRLSLD
ncbi:MAG: GNAT family N-acetyltransferase [Actinobacteria bacterium]|nr:GNAT family N-acetyltransferase [Actinomycetota bacterium]